MYKNMIVILCNHMEKAVSAETPCILLQKSQTALVQMKE